MDTITFFPQDKSPWILILVHAGMVSLICLYLVWFWYATKILSLKFAFMAV